jgi:hypothetical protein
MMNMYSEKTLLCLFFDLLLPLQSDPLGVIHIAKVSAVIPAATKPLAPQ